MDIVKALEFRVKLDRQLAKHSFDEILEDTDFQDFPLFLTTRMGQIWLTKDNGTKYRSWQKNG